MRMAETIEGLAGFRGRGAGRDAERRAARWIAAELRATRPDTQLETFWCRPAWPLAQAWHLALALAGSLVAVSHPQVGSILLLVALLCVLADAVLGISPGRRLTPERASQNVVSPPPGGPNRESVQLVLTANLDAGGTGLVHRPALRRASARLRTLAGGRAPGWAAWLSLLIAWTLATGLVRVEGGKSGALAVAQIIPTLGLVIALALLLDLGSAEWSPGANDNASGVAVALALARALDTAPPANLAVTLVIAGAGDGQGIGLRHHLRARSSSYRPQHAIVLGFGPSGAGTPHWLASDGPLVPLAFFHTLRRLAASPELGLTERRARGTSPALPGRARGIPSITLGAALAPNGEIPGSHRPQDTPEHLEPAALEATLQAGLLLVDAIDEHLAARRA
jgi:hypothetical protein